MLGSRISFFRRRLGMSQEELANRLSISPAALGAYEQGRRCPSGAMLVAMSQALDVSVELLLTGQPGSSSEIWDAVEYDLQHSSRQMGGQRKLLAARMLLMLLDDR